MLDFSSANNPEKTKKAILEAGFNPKLSQSLKDSKRGNK